MSETNKITPAQLRELAADKWTNAGQMQDALRQAADEIDRIEADLAKARRGLTAVQELIADSYGVAGLHRNGDVAPWHSLQTGGQFEPWLLDFDEAVGEVAE